MPFLQKNIFFDHNHPKNTIFLIFVWNFRFPCFLFSYFLFSFSNIKRQNQKCRCFYRRPIFWHPDNLPKNFFSHPYTLFVLFKITKNTINWGKTSKNKSWTKFWRNLGPSFDSKKPKSWTKFWLYSGYIYIYREREREEEVGRKKMREREREREKKKGNKEKQK